MGDRWSLRVRRQAAGWGEVDDDQWAHAIRMALEIDVTFFDTADVYGCGRSARVLGRALKGRREQAVIATKFRAPLR